MSQIFTHGYALLVGIGQCAEPQLSLPVTVKDAQALQRILTNSSLCAYPDNDQHIRLLNDARATKQSILDGMAWLRAQLEADPEGTAIVYYSGHGWLETTSSDYYLIPHDFDSYDWRNSALSTKAFNQALHQIPAKRLLVILDCCHAAGMATPKENTSEPRLPKGVVSTADPKDLIDSLKQGEGRVVFTSCRGEQKSWIRPDNTLSIYTHHLIEALQGAASPPGATEVTVFDLANHLGKVVPKSAAAIGEQQTPRFEMAETERFAISLLQGGKGLPTGGWAAIKPQPTIVNQVQISASGERSVAIGGNAVGSTIITGNNNVTGSGNIIQRGQNNFSFDTASNFSIGDTIHTDRTSRESQPPTPQQSNQQPSGNSGHRQTEKPIDNLKNEVATDQKEVFISYAWGGKSEEIANQIDEICKTKSISLIRDKNHLGFKGRIKAFMEQIGRGKCVVIVISEKYLKSENCMFELLQIAKNEQFYERIFPVVLDDAKIYKPKDRIQYVQHWEQEIQELDQQIRSVSSANLEGFREDIDLYNEIRQYLPRLTNILKDMNTLTAQIHSESGFEELIKAIQHKLNE
ncbi:caspase family protein [Leptothoe sp. EHU-05/26/07-4]